jgi:hypothetical protein
VVNGVQFGDLIEFVDFDYTARVAKVNGAALWGLATNPETTAADWTSVIDAGDVTAVTLDISKDNVQFGVRAVDKAGHRSPVAFPQVAA